VLWQPPIPPKRTKKKLACKVDCPSGKWTVNNPLSTPNTTWTKKTLLLSHPQEKREAPSLHGVPSHRLQGNSIAKIGCHYFWPELIALPKNNLPIMSVDATSFRSLFLLISTVVVGESRRLAPIPIWREVYWWRLGREKAVLRRDLWLTRDVDHCWAGTRNCIKPLLGITVSQKNKIPNFRYISYGSQFFN
jgi:hypothetical protein